MSVKENRSEKKQELLILKHAVENTNEAFVTIDGNHKVLFFNKAAEKVFGYSRDEVVGHDLDVIMSPACSLNHREAVTRYVRTRIPTRIGHESELVATRKNGDNFPASISFSVTEVEGEPIFTGIVRDITETRALQDQIMQSERMAALGQLVAEITHEIKNPLMMIGGFARQLIKVSDDKKSLKKLSIIAEEVNRLENLLADLREYHLPRAIISEPVNIKELFQEIYTLVSNDLKKKHIKTSLEIDEKALLVSGDVERLEQVFLNLVKNSIEAMEPGGNLSIKTSLSGDQVIIAITDDGCGIPKEDIQKIFSPFFTTKPHGTGLGLCISKRIVEEHKGSSFTLKSEEGKGTTFEINLPLSHEHAFENTA
jgi:two-component system sensor kinase FixL